MSRVQELQSKITSATSKLRERQRDMEYWMKELQNLNRELKHAIDEEADRAKHQKAA